MKKLFIIGIVVGVMVFMILIIRKTAKPFSISIIESSNGQTSVFCAGKIG